MQTIERDNVLKIVVIGMQMMLKFRRHVQLYVNLDHMLINLLTNVLIDVRQIIMQYKQIENVFNFVHMVGSQINLQINVSKDVLLTILMLIVCSEFV